MTEEQALKKYQEYEKIIGTLIKRKGVNEEPNEVSKCFIAPVNFMSLDERDYALILTGAEDDYGLIFPGPYEVFLSFSVENLIFYLSSQDFDSDYEQVPDYT